MPDRSGQKKSILGFLFVPLGAKTKNKTTKMKFSLLTKLLCAENDAETAYFVQIVYKKINASAKFYFYHKRNVLLFFESCGKINESDMR